MDADELAASLQAIMDQRGARQTEAPPPDFPPAPEPSPVPVRPVEPDPFYEQYFAPATTATLPPVYEPIQFDDHLLEETESAGNIMASTSSNAAYRAKRTGYQGLLASALVAVGGVFASLSLDADVDWRLLGLSVGQAVLTAVITFLHNDNSADSASA
ncbi:hypothetical protein [Acrocarpospora sp. B8E8]|uniref:hypothetical protein n=1 Tax=Acrocarpospora sp. B8E8 TaxID=3153572 RepID=UPI00325E0531